MLGRTATSPSSSASSSGRTRSNAVASCLQSGDILIKYSDGSTVNRIIGFGQFFGRGPSKFTHAGIASSPSSIIEMDGHGLQEHNLVTENGLISYDAFRCTMPDIAAGASEADCFAEFILGPRCARTRRPAMTAYLSCWDL